MLEDLTCYAVHATLRKPMCKHLLFKQYGCTFVSCKDCLFFVYIAVLVLGSPVEYLASH